MMTLPAIRCMEMGPIQMKKIVICPLCAGELEDSPCPGCGATVTRAFVLSLADLVEVRSGKSPRPLSDSIGGATSSAIPKDSWGVLLDESAISGQPEIPLRKESIVIGRGQNCDLVIPPTGFGQFLSSQHAKLEFRDNRFYLTDLGSQNSTYYGSQKLTPHEPTEIKPNEPFSLYTVTFRLKSEQLSTDSIVSREGLAKQSVAVVNQLSEIGIDTTPPPSSSRKITMEQIVEEPIWQDILFEFFKKGDNSPPYYLLPPGNSLSGSLFLQRISRTGFAVSGVVLAKCAEVERLPPPQPPQPPPPGPGPGGGTPPVKPPDLYDWDGVPEY